MKQLIVCIFSLVNLAVHGQVQVFDSDMNIKCYYVLDGEYSTSTERINEFFDQIVEKNIYRAIYYDENGDSEIWSDGVATVKFWTMLRGRQHWVECRIDLPAVYHSNGQIAMREWSMTSSGVYEQTIESGGVKYNVYTNDILGPSDFIYVPLSR